MIPGRRRSARQAGPSTRFRYTGSRESSYSRERKGTCKHGVWQWPLRSWPRSFGLHGG